MLQPELSLLKKDKLEQNVLTYHQLTEGLKASHFSYSKEELSTKVHEAFDAIIVLDDDPTGTQTVHDIPVLTEWSETLLANELLNDTKLFYILTNSRALNAEKAEILGLEIARNIKNVQEDLNKNCLVISRSDSTLRGHYPLEINVLSQVFQKEKGVHFIVPAFFEGGRYTIDNVHYVREGEQMIPAANTPFAQDKVFGFKSSNLKDWIKEKYNSEIEDTQIHTISLDELQNVSSGQTIKKINQFQSGDVCIINAASYDDLNQAIYCIFSSNVYPFFRSAASLIAALASQKPKLISNKDLPLESKNGGLTVLGSYVPKSTSQLAHVLANVKIESIEIDIEALLNNTGKGSQDFAEQIDNLISVGKDVILYTSRKLISSTEKEANLNIGSIVSTFLTDIVAALKVTPKYVIGKGGITSSDLATKSLGLKRAMVMGQMIPGVPVWKTFEGSKFPYMPFIVYPGNVGDETGLSQVIEILKA